MIVGLGGSQPSFINLILLDCQLLVVKVTINQYANLSNCSVDLSTFLYIRGILSYDDDSCFLKFILSDTKLSPYHMTSRGCTQVSSNFKGVHRITTVASLSFVDGFGVKT